MESRTREKILIIRGAHRCRRVRLIKQSNGKIKIRTNREGGLRSLGGCRYYLKE